MSDPKVYELGIEELRPDEDNANAGSERGQYMIDTSVEVVGLARGIVVDRDNMIIGGNKLAQAAADAGFKRALVVETDGDTLVVTKRRDLDLDDPDPNNRARQAAYFDNRAGEVDLAWDAYQLAADLDAGLDLSALFFEEEVAEILAAEADAQLGAPPDGRSTSLGTGKALIRPAVAVEEVATVERALRMTGEKSRGGALVAVCQAYLDLHGGFGFDADTDALLQSLGDMSIEEGE